MAKGSIDIATVGKGEVLLAEILRGEQLTSEDKRTTSPMQPTAVDCRPSHHHKIIHELLLVQSRSLGYLGHEERRGRGEVICWATWKNARHISRIALNHTACERANILHCYLLEKICRRTVSGGLRVARLVKVVKEIARLCRDALSP